MATMAVSIPVNQSQVSCKFTVSPFSSSPDPTAVYKTSAFKSALYKIDYTIEHGQGLAALLGDPGLGKSTMMRYLYSKYSATPGYLCSFTPNPAFRSDYSLLKKLVSDFGEEPRRSMYAQQSRFEEWLGDRYSEGIRPIIFIDEGQRLDSEQLELLRSLLNFESDKEKLIQIVIAGNLDLRDRLVQKKNKAFLSRIFAPTIVTSMTYDEMLGMLEVRCERSSIPWPFEVDALRLIYDWSAGIPRTVLQICEFSYAQALLMARPAVTAEIVNEVLPKLKVHDEQSVVPVKSIRSARKSVAGRK